MVSLRRLIFFVAFFTKILGLAAAIKSPQNLRVLASVMTKVTLKDSGPINVTVNGQVVENLRIKVSSGEPAIKVNGFSDVIIRNVEIIYQNSAGIDISNSPRITLQDISLLHSGAPAVGANPSPSANGISCLLSDNFHALRIRIEKASTGIYLNQCHNSVLSLIEIHDIRGPYPRGQGVQFNTVKTCSLSDFSIENPLNTSWPEDSISLFRTTNCKVQRGLIDGNNSPTGGGVTIESGDYTNPTLSSDTLVQDVDVINVMTGCFGAYPASKVTFRNLGCRDTLCGTSRQTADITATKFLAISAHPISQNLNLYASKYYNLCYPLRLIWDQTRYTTIEFISENFKPRAPIRLQFPW